MILVVPVATRGSIKTHYKKQTHNARLLVIIFYMAGMNRCTLLRSMTDGLREGG